MARRGRYRATKNPPPDAPVVAVLLYRKHVITRQPYLNQLARLPTFCLSFPSSCSPSLLVSPQQQRPSCETHRSSALAESRCCSSAAACPPAKRQVYGLEEQGLIPVPIFINGIEAHTVVRDSLTTAHEQRERAVGNAVIGSLKPNAISVDAVVSTIGFPLVGAPGFCCVLSQLTLC